MLKRLSLLSLCVGSLVFTSCDETEVFTVRGTLVVEPLISGNHGSYVDVDKVESWLGEVPLYSKSEAKFRITNTGMAPARISSIVQRNSRGQGRFVVESYPDKVEVKSKKPPEYIMVVSYQPMTEWVDSNNNDRADEKEFDRASFVIQSDATNDSVEFTVTGYGVDKGAPELKVCFGNYCGPKEGDCINGRCELGSPLDFGNVSFGSSVNQTLLIKNQASCPYPSEWGTCSHKEYCALDLAPDLNNYNLGMGILDQDNGDRFTIYDGSSLPISLVQPSFAEDHCGKSNTHEVLLTYAAREKLQSDIGRLILETNDPKASLVIIPLKARSCQVPKAVCQLKAADPDNPMVPYSVAGQLRPYSRIYLDGSASYNPLGTDGKEAVVSYSWRILSYPDGANPDDFSPHGAASKDFDFNAPLSGEYKVALTVSNSDGISSNETTESICTLKVDPGSKIHVQHTWDNPVNDQDLHLVYMGATGGICNKATDCNWQNKKPVWFSDYQPGEGPNPRLDHDDKDGLGPENLNIDEPIAGRYRLYVHYYDDPASPSGTATLNTLRIYLNGLLAGEYKRALSVTKDMWAAVDIIWDDKNPQVVPLENGGNEVGWVCQVPLCNEIENVVCEP